MKEVLCVFDHSLKTELIILCIIALPLYFLGLLLAHKLGTHIRFIEFFPQTEGLKDMFGLKQKESAVGLNFYLVDAVSFRV